MALIARYLADTSALARLDQEPVRVRLRPLIERALVATCDVVNYEIGRTARSIQEYDRLMADRRLLYAQAVSDSDDVSEAMEIQRSLVEAGTHRGVGLPDLLIAISAHRDDLIVLHYDHDFDLISAMLPVRTEWIVPAGTAD